MTQVKHKHKLVRETLSELRGVPIILEIESPVPDMTLLTFRLKGQKTRFSISAVTAMEYAIKLEAAALMRRRKEEREAKRKANKGL